MTDAVAVESAADDIALLGLTVDEFLSDRCSEADLRAVMDSEVGYDADAWRRMAQQLGLAGLVIPESSGGVGCGLAELAVVLESCGKALYGGPLLGHSIAAWGISQSQQVDEAVRQAAAAGELTLTVALPHGSVFGSPALPLARDDTLTGEIPVTLHAATADGLVVEALSAAGTSGLWLVTDRASIRTGAAGQLDPTRRSVTAILEATPAQLIGGVEAAARLRDAAAVALANEQVGGAAALLTAVVDYVKVREQFGQPIGSFQAVKHHCADVLLAVESARSIARRAARALDDGADDAREYASIAKAWCSEAYVAAAETSLQLHGGIGYTWEHSTQLHLKRAKTTELMFGDARFHRSRLGRLLGLTKESA